MSYRLWRISDEGDLTDLSTIPVPWIQASRAEAYDTPDINFLVGLTSSAKISAAANGTAALMPNSFGNGIDPKRDPALPASHSPKLVERNHMPIAKPAARAGASFVIALKPTGLRHISPITLRK